jgi:ketosteroid isomerase-like protein
MPEKAGDKVLGHAERAATAELQQSIVPTHVADHVAQLVARAAEKNAAFMRGEMYRWSELVNIAPDFTLMQPFGGPPSRGFDQSTTRMAEMARYFRKGKTDLELVQTCSSEHLAVLVMIERQTAEVGGLPEQDWSLRVTEVYRKAESKWNLVHRHADPLVRHIGLEQAAALACGCGVRR